MMLHFRSSRILQEFIVFKRFCLPIHSEGQSKTEQYYPEMEFATSRRQYARVPPISTNRKLKPPTSLYLLLFIFLFLSFSRPLPLLRRGPEFCFPRLLAPADSVRRSPSVSMALPRVSVPTRLGSIRPRLGFFARERRRDKMTTMTGRNGEIDVAKRSKRNRHSRERLA